MVCNVYLWQNRMVMAFNHNGEQIADLQGPAEDVGERVLEAATEETKFHCGVWRGRTAEISRERFAALCGVSVAAEKETDGPDQNQ